MKTIVKGLLILFGLVNSVVSADVMGEADDTYVGVQMTTSLDTISGGLFSGQHQYQLNYLLLQQNDGIKNGVAFTQDSYGNQTLNYLRPSTTFDIGQSRVVDYAVPIMNIEALDDPAGGKSNADTSAAVAVVGIAALVVVGITLKNDLEKDWEPDD